MVARKHGPFYKLSDLVKACKSKGKVFVRKETIEKAKLIGFDTDVIIINFISNNEFEDLLHENTSDIDLGPDAGITFDAYIFRIGPKSVYLAFYKRNNGFWIIKSFHAPELGENAPVLTHTPFAILGGIK